MLPRPLSSLSLPRPILSSLIKAGYENTEDLKSTSAAALAEDLNIPLQSAESIFQAYEKSPTPMPTLPLTQSAASMVSSAEKFSTRSSALDRLLSGGIQRGEILEISGPPGTPKESVVIGIVTSFVEAGEGVIFIDTQNMTSPAKLNKYLQLSKDLPYNYLNLVRHVNVQSLSDLMVLIHNTPVLLGTHPKVSLLILNSLSFFFQGGQNLTVSAKNALLEKIKQTLARASASHNLTIVSTSQLATKILNADGSPGTFDTGARGVMVPQLGTAYLPSGKTHRIIFAPRTKRIGVIKILSSPAHQGKGSKPQVLYEISADGRVL